MVKAPRRSSTANGASGSDKTPARGTTSVQKPKAGASVVPPSTGKSASRNSTPMDIENPELQEKQKLVEDESYVSTEINDQFYDLGKYFTELPEDAARRIVPYKGQFGKGEDFFKSNLADSTSEYDTLKKAYTMVYYKKKTPSDVDLLQVEDCKLNLAVMREITTWICTSNNQATTYLSDDILFEAMVILSRLSYTPPNKLFGRVKSSKVDKSLASTLWWCAKLCLGSWYTKEKKRESIQSDIRTAFKKQEAAASGQADSPIELDTPGSPSAAGNNKSDVASPQWQLSKSTKNPKSYKSKAAAALVQCQTRLTFKIEIPDLEGKTQNASDYALAKVKEYFVRLKAIEPHASILAWYKRDAEDKKAIVSLKDFPTSISGLKALTTAFRPTSKKTTYFSMCIGHNNDEVHLTSLTASDLSDWFDDNNTGAYLSTVKDSDDTVTAGHFLYATSAVDADNLHEVINQTLTVALRGSALPQGNKKNQFGMRASKNREMDNIVNISTYQENRDWKMKASNMLRVECDRSLSKHLLRVIAGSFNNKNKEYGPGLYHFRFLPAQEFTRSGTNGLMYRNQALHKHMAVISSVELIKNSDIKALDTTADCLDGKKRTLREVLMKEVTYPLVIDEEDNEQEEQQERQQASDPKQKKESSSEVDRPKPKMFFMVDMCNSGPEKGLVYHLITYKDRVGIADSFSEILPKYCKEFYGETAAQAWFHPLAIANAEDSTLDFDEEGNWMGTWSTSDDLMLQGLAQEDVGIQLDGLDLLQNFNDAAQATFTAEDQSVKSFYTSAGLRAPQQPEQVIPAGQEAAANPDASGEGGGVTG